MRIKRCRVLQSECASPRRGPCFFSMASFQNTGRLFDGVGVEPDIYLDPVPEYYLLNGQDRVLERAIQIIMGRNPS